MSLRTIKDENGFYVELPKDKIKFVSKEAEIMFDLSLENDYLQQENQELKDNWNKLKEYAKEIISTDNELYGTDLLNKMKELEQESDKK